MSTINRAIQADSTRIAYQSALTLAKAGAHAAKHMQWRNAARLYDQAADALDADPHGSTCTGESLYRRRAAICRAMVPCTLPSRPLPDAVDYHRRQREGSAA